MVSPGHHAVLLLDQVGWHMSRDVAGPDNITLLPLPPTCPDLNAEDNVWPFIRDNWLSNRILQAYDDIADRCCDACNRLVENPWRSMSVGMRDWAHRH